MFDFVDSIFPGAGMVGDSGLFGTERGSTTSTSAPWGPQQPYLKDLFKQSQNQFNAAQGSPFASLLKQRATQGNPLSNAGMTLATNTLKGDYLNPYSNPFFGGALSQAMNDAKSKINAQFQGNNYGSSAHQEWLSKGMMGAASPLLAGAYQTNLDNQNRVLGMSPALANQDLDLMAQAEQLPWANLLNYKNAVGGGYGGVTENPFYQNNTANTLGALAGGAAAFKAFSDRRLKTDIEKIGEKDGLNVYAFNYVWGGDRQVGFMADEVEQVRPDVVSEVMGFKVVDYGVFP